MRVNRQRRSDAEQPLGGTRRLLTRSSMTQTRARSRGPNRGGSTGSREVGRIKLNLNPSSRLPVDFLSKSKARWYSSGTKSVPCSNVKSTPSVSSTRRCATTCDPRTGRRTISRRSRPRRTRRDTPSPRPSTIPGIMISNSSPGSTSRSGTGRPCGRSRSSITITSSILTPVWTSMPVKRRRKSPPSYVVAVSAARTVRVVRNTQPTVRGQRTFQS